MLDGDWSSDVCSSDLYAKICPNPDHHACMKAITPEWVAARFPELAAGTLKPGQDWPGGLRSF
jgi:heptosyltransferase-2